MSDAGSDHDNQKPKGVFSTLTADGDWLFLKGEYKKAIDHYTKALDLKPDDKNCLVGRSKCYLRIGQTDEALRDAEDSLKGDKSFCEGLHQKAEALYYKGEFEFALVMYHRGQKLRPQIQEFRLGIQKAQEAIRNAVGPSSVKLQVKGDLSVHQKDEEGPVPSTSVEHPMTAKKNPTQKSPKSDRTTKHLLGEFYHDKKYLEKLLKDPDLIKGKTKRGERVHDVIQDGLRYLDTCHEFRNQEKPICSQEGDAKVRRKKLSKTRHSAPADSARFLLRSLQEIDDELTNGNAKAGLQKAKEVMKTACGWSEKEVPNKKEVLGTLHSCIGNALMDLGDMDKALDHHQKDLELAKECKIPEAISRSLENIGRVYVRTGEFSKAIEFWEQKIPMVQDGVEKTWLFHEIGWCYLELSCYGDARDYGIRSVAAADESGDEKWQMNANVLAAQSERKLGNPDAAVSYFKKALILAKQQGDDCIMAAIQKAIDETVPSQSR